MGQQPLSKEIDEDIRSLVALLNDASYIQTIAACSGHPQIPDKEWRDGWVTMKPVGSQERLWDFLHALRARLDNTTAVKMTQYYHSVFGDFPQRSHIDKIYEHYRAVGGESLFLSGIPILTVHNSFVLCPFCTTPDKALLIWENILRGVEDFVSRELDKSNAAYTAEAAANALVKQLCTISHIQGITLTQDNHCRWRIEFEATGDRNACLWCWDLISHVNGVLSREEEFQPQEDGRKQFLADGSFVLRPIVRNGFVERTREEHLKIWKLIELTAQELVHREVSGGTGNTEATSGRLDFMTNRSID